MQCLIRGRQAGNVGSRPPESSLQASEETVCFGNVFWDIRGGAWNPLGSYECLVCTPGRNLVILDSSLSRPTSSPSINHMSALLSERTSNSAAPHHPPGPRVLSSLAELWQSSPNLTSCSCPRDLQPVLHTTTSLPRAEHVRPLPEPSSGLPCRWGQGEPPLSPSPPGVLMVWLLLTFSTSFPATLPEAVPSVSLLSGFLITL